MALEPVSVDQDRLGALFSELGEAAAEDTVCRAMEELALRLSHCSRLHKSGHWEDLCKCVKSLRVISERIGMVFLARVADDVIDTVNARDPVAISATLARLLRIGEQSLTAIWDLQDITI